jgi:serine phosphatase RsbU (regulator of sigma subunit)
MTSEPRSNNGEPPGNLGIDDLRKFQDSVQNPTDSQNTAKSAGVELRVKEKRARDEILNGDFYQIIRLPNGGLAIFLGDATGHGKEAAASGIALHKFMRSPHFLEYLQTENHTSSELLQFIDKNASLPPDSNALTLAVVILNPTTGQLQYANAGLPALMILRNSGSMEKIDSSGLYVGHGDYSLHNSGTTTVVLERGEKCIFVTDGISEARMENRKLVGKELPFLFADETRQKFSVDEIAEFVFRFSERSDDDATVICFAH